MQIERTRGDTYPDSMTVTNVKTKAIVNLSGCSFKLTVSSVQNPPDASTQLYQLIGVIENPTTGVVTFSPTAEQANLVGLFFFDVQMTDSYNQVITLTSGTYYFKQDITK